MTQPRCLSVAPIMPSTDIARTAAFYTRLGFVMDEPDGDFLMIRRDDIDIFSQRQRKIDAIVDRMRKLVRENKRVRQFIVCGNGNDRRVQ